MRIWGFGLFLIAAGLVGMALFGLHRQREAAVADPPGPAIAGVPGGRIVVLPTPSRPEPPPAPGMHAVIIPVEDDAEVLASLGAGDLVDVLLTRETEGQLVSSVILQTATVLAVDLRVDRAEPSSPVVTLEVTTAQAQKLALARQVGRLSLVRRAGGTPREPPRQRAPGPAAPVVVDDDPDPEEEFARLCGPATQPPRPPRVLYPDGRGYRDGRGVCARKIPGVNERPYHLPLQRLDRPSVAELP